VNALLIDENLPRGLNLPAALPVTHATDLGSSLTDTQLWEHAREHGCVILTKDTDFSDRAMLQPPPPWVVWCKLGNLRRKVLADTLRRTWPTIESLLPDHRLITLNPDAVHALA